MTLFGRPLRWSPGGIPTDIAQSSCFKGELLKKLALLISASTIFLITTLASAQQLDFAVGGSTLFSTRNSTSSINFLPPGENGGVYPSASVQYVLDNHFGINVEGAFRYREGTYNNYQHFRPVLYDVNAVYAPPLSKKVSLDLMAGVGGETLIFYSQLGTCYTASGCRSYVNDNHLLLHFGGDFRYYFWRDVFVRPEANYYYIHNNYEFHSNNVLRLGASIGITFGSH